MAHAFTIGVEEEFQIVDPETWRAAVARLGAADRQRPVARRSDQARAPPVDRRGRHAGSARTSPSSRTRSAASAASCPQSAESVGLHIAAAGTHPFSNWKDQVISPGERYENIVEELQQLARSLLIFGLHIHVAVPDRASTIELLNEARYFLPHLLALSTSSPFWQGRDTGLEVVPHDRVPPLPAQRHPRPVQLVERVRGIRRTRSSSCTASTTARRSGGICGRIRSSARSSSASATCRPRRA